ncbi:MAG: hypothetical protein P8R42_01300 [Candidatus Binatia bacterium]|nr:hypothetical protein [Candidatus Binatia bacterium]
MRGSGPSEDSIVVGSRRGTRAWADPDFVSQARLTQWVIRGAAGTLLELLVFVAIIGILAAIAISQFSAYRAQGFNARFSSDIRNMATAQEAYVAANAAYTSDVASLTGFAQSPGVNLTVTPAGTFFTAVADHTNGDKTFNWDSANGGLQDAP